MNEEHNLKERTSRGLAWSGMSSFTTQMLNLVIGIFLARLLSPADYGIVGMLAIFSALAGNVQDAGFTQSLINLHRPTARDYGSVFWFSSSISLLLYIMLFLTAPLIARFYHAPELTLLARILFLGFFVASLSIPSGAWLRKNLHNREMAIINVTALTLSGITGIIMALCGTRYWALVAQQLTYISATTIGRFICCPWRPSLTWDFSPVKGMMRFGVNIFLTNVVGTLSQNILTVIFGRFLTRTATGFFTRANMWNTMGHQLVTGTTSQLAQTVFVEVGDDPERELRVWRKMLRFTAFVSMPAMLGLALISHEVTAIIGPQWAPSAPLLRILAIGGAFMPIYTLYQNIIISHEQGRSYMLLNVAQVIILLLMALILAPHGTLAVVTGYTVLQISYLLPWQWVVGHYTGVRLHHVINDIMPYLLASIFVMMLTWAVTHGLESQPFWLLLLLRIPLAATLYTALMWVRHDDILTEILRYAKR